MLKIAALRIATFGIKDLCDPRIRTAELIIAKLARSYISLHASGLLSANNSNASSC